MCGYKVWYNTFELAFIFCHCAQLIYLEPADVSLFINSRFKAISNSESWESIPNLLLIETNHWFDSTLYRPYLSLSFAYRSAPAVNQNSELMKVLKVILNLSTTSTDPSCCVLIAYYLPCHDCSKFFG